MMTGKMNLRLLQPYDVTQSYVDWFKDPRVTFFSDSQYKSFSISTQQTYVRKCLNDKNIELYGIFDDDLHIGNVCVTGVRSRHKRADISYLIGDVNYWGLGIGTYAIASMIDIIRSSYDLNKLCAGVAEQNKGSIRVLEKNKFKLEGKRKNHLFYNGIFYNQLDFGLLFI